MSFLLIVGLYATWTSSFAIGKMTLLYTSPIFITSIRMLLAGFILIAFLYIRKRKNLKITLSQLFPILILAVLSIYLTNILEFWGLQHLSAGKTCFIYSLSPFFSAIFSYLHFKEKMNLKKSIGMIIGFIGFIPVLLVQSGSENLFGGISFISWPELAVMGAALFSVYGWVLLRILVKKNSLSPITANGYSMLIGGAIALIHSLLVDKWSPTPIVAGGVFPVIQGTLVLTFLSNIVCYNLYGWLLKKYTATFLSFVGLLSPFFASLTGYIFLGESPSWIIFASTIVVGSGLLLVYQAELKQGYIVKKAKLNKVALPEAS
jgi:drug/metabolite transporter (DMT)-like permease